MVCLSVSSSDVWDGEGKEIVIKTVFKGSGHIILSYLKPDFRGASLHIKNTLPGDTVIYTVVKSDLPVVFYHVRRAGKDLLKSSFIAESGDTLSLSVNETDVTSEEGNSKSDALNQIYGTSSVIKTERAYTGTDIKKLVDSFETLQKVYEDKIYSIGTKNHYSHQFLRALLSYNRLLTFAGIFKINYAAIKNDGDAAFLLNQYYQKLVAQKELLAAIYASEIKAILYYSILFSSWKNGKADRNFYEQIRYMDTAFYRKEYTDGFLYDKMRTDESLSTIQQRKELLLLLKPVIKEEEAFLVSSGFKIRSFDNDVLNTSLQGFNSKMVSLKETLGHTKKITIIDFWASWCAPCLAELPALRKIKAKYKNQVEVISISIDENRQQWLAACKRYNITVNSFLNVAGKESPLVRFLQLNSIPRLIIINAKGDIIEDDFYRPSDNKFEFELNNILNTEF
jgi:thiol-disulfide isomerase/thioredoxin